VTRPKSILADPEYLRVLELLASGKTAIAIGREMYLSPDAVKTRLRRLYAQLGANNAAHAVLIAVRQGLLDPWRDDQCAWHEIVIHDKPDSFTGERVESMCPDECRLLAPGAVCWFVHEPFRAQWPTEPGTYRIRPYYHTVACGEDGDVEMEFQIDGEPSLERTS